MSRAYTPEECQAKIIEMCHAMASYWESVARQGHNHPFHGLAFSILAELDGDGMLPHIRLVSDPHPDDMEYHKENGENWWPADMEIPGPLHERFYK